MDASMMDAEGGRVHLLERRAKRLVVIVALQNLLVAACLLLTLYAYCAQEPVSNPESNSAPNIHIQFTPIAAVEGNTTLEFNGEQSWHMMSLDKEKKDVFYFNCTGPYILYMHLCYMSMDGKEANGTLQLLVGSKTPEILFSLSTSSEECKTTEFQKIVNVREKGKASLQLESIGSFKFKDVTVGLSSLLGGQCLF